MDPDSIYILIPLAPFLLAAFVIWTRHQSKMLDRQGVLAAEKAAQYGAHVERIEARLRVIEKIVTDAGAETANQIEALRERRSIEGGEPLK